MDKFIIAYHTFKNQKYELNNSFEEKEVFVRSPKQLKETKVRRFVFHNDKRQAKSKEKVFVPQPEQLKETKVVVNAFNNFEKREPGLDKSLEEKEVFISPP